jgi:hypothetical protein
MYVSKTFKYYRVHTQILFYGTSKKYCKCTKYLVTIFVPSRGGPGSGSEYRKADPESLLIRAREETKEF